MGLNPADTSEAGPSSSEANYFSAYEVGKAPQVGGTHPTVIFSSFGGPMQLRSWEGP